MPKSIKNFVIQWRSKNSPNSKWQFWGGPYANDTAKSVMIIVESSSNPRFEYQKQEVQHDQTRAEATKQIDNERGGSLRK